MPATARHRAPAPVAGPGRGRVLFTLADQMVSSASNFALSALVARIGGVEALGAFGVALLIWFAVVGVNRALVTEPLTVVGRPEEMARENRAGFAASVVVGCGAALVLAAGCGFAAEGGLTVTGVLALAPWLPSLLAQDFCRAAAFRARRPHVALISDVVFAVVQVAATFLLAAAGDLGVGAFLAAWGVGATAGAAVGALLLHVRPGIRGGAALLAGLWARSRWFLAEFGTAFPSDQGYLLLLPLVLGTAQFGLYRSASGLIGPVVVLFLAAGNVGLPEAVRSLRDAGPPGLRRFTLRLTAAVLAASVLYCGTVALLAEPLLRLVYGEAFAPAAGTTVAVAAQYILYALAFGAGVALKASGRMRALWVVRAVSAVVTIGGAAVLTSTLGLAGAGIAAVVAGAVYATGVLVAYRLVGWRAGSAGGAVEVADPAGGNARHQRVGGHVGGHDGAGRHDGARADHHTRQDRDVRAEPGA